MIKTTVPRWDTGPTCHPDGAEQRAVAPRPERGYTLIEVLLAAGIVLLAMTGMLTMQLVGIKIAQNAYHRTQATTLAYQMTDYLRANCPANPDVDPYPYPNSTYCRAGYRAESDNRICNFDASTDIDPTTSIENRDLQEWWLALDASELPHWFAQIHHPTNSDLFFILVQWDDARVREGSDDEGETTTSCLGTVLPTGLSEVCLTTIPCAITE